MAENSIFRATTFLFLITIGSKLTGFLKEVFIARTFGATYETDAFVVASTIPNSLFYIISGGLTTVIIPTYAKYIKERNILEFNNLYSNLVSQLLIFSVLSSLIGVFFSNQIVQLIATGFSEDAIFLSGNLLKIMFPTLIFTVLISINTGLLNTQKVFGVGEISPLILNLFIIIFCLTVSKIFGIYALSYAVFFGTLVSLLYILFKMRGSVFSFNFRVKFDDDIKYIYKLMLPIVLSSGVIEIYIIIDKYLASNMSEGSISSLNFAHKILGFPEGLLVAFSSVLFPTLSQLAFEEDKKDFSGTIFSGLKIIMLLAVPISIIILILSSNIVGFLFEGGNFSKEASEKTSSVLFYFSLAILSLGTNPLLYRAFFALHETVKPLLVSIISVIVNIILSISLSRLMGLEGLALANSIAMLVNVILQLYLLKAYLVKNHFNDFYKFTFKIFFIGIFTFLVSAGLNNLFTFESDFIQILLIGSLVLVIFFVLTIFLKVKELEILRSKLSEKFLKKKSRKN